MKKIDPVPIPGDSSGIVIPVNDAEGPDSGAKSADRGDGAKLPCEKVTETSSFEAERNALDGLEYFGLSADEPNIAGESGLMLVEGRQRRVLALARALEALLTGGCIEEARAMATQLREALEGRTGLVVPDNQRNKVAK